MNLHQHIEQHWQTPKPWLSLILWPLSRVFAGVAKLRRELYRSGRLHGERLPVPVVVVGNIHAGGTGKTPVVSTLVRGLQQRGVKVGVISRGYGRENTKVHVLNPNSRVADAGDEPLMLYRQTGVPIAVGSKRIEAGRALLAAYPDLECLVADDGLQHYALARDIEIAVFPASDAARCLDVLPNGGLREHTNRLKDVDAVVFSGCDQPPQTIFSMPVAVFCSHINAGEIYHLNNPQQKWNPQEAAGQIIAALAGIARPARFFESLREQGIILAETRVLPDHAPLTRADLPQADCIIITEKDAVKLADNAPENVWVLPVCAIIEPDLTSWLQAELARLR
ncbi:MAG: tetraacyldisaccharide 4'-kinase [Neisseria sp.]|mgnify:FL=1